MWGAIVVIAGLAVVASVFFGALAHYTDSKDVVAVVGAVTGVVGTIVTAFFGIRATANAGSDATQKVAAAGNQATQTVKDANDKALAAAAYIPASQAAEFVDKLGINPHQ
jgi:ammonia channel protein AmtB